MHPIQEVLVQRLLLDEDYVFCGTDAYWGTNSYGLFVFDRKAETWTNYPRVEGPRSVSGTVKNITRSDNYVDVQFSRGLIRFNLNTGEVSFDTTRAFERSPLTFHLEVDSRRLTFTRDRITVSGAGEDRIYTAATSPPHHPIKGTPLAYWAFCSPVVYGDRVYFGVNSDGPGDLTLGLGSFGLEDTTFRFYPSDIFRGRTTSAFVRGSSIIFATARFNYEANATPAGGLVQFTPGDSSFRIWDEIPLPDYPVAVFCLEQDDREYWLGTDRGVFKIDKSTDECVHYGITKGTVAREGVNVHGCYGDLGSDRNQYPVVAELSKGDTVELLEIYHGWCKIKAPVEIRGHVSSSDVVKVSGEERPQTIKVVPEAVVRADSRPDANVLVRFGLFSNPPEEEYLVVGYSSRADSVKWYHIRMPTAWIYRNDLTFSMEEIR